MIICSHPRPSFGFLDLQGLENLKDPCIPFRVPRPSRKPETREGKDAHRSSQSKVERATQEHKRSLGAKDKVQRSRDACVAVTCAG